MPEGAVAAVAAVAGREDLYDEDDFDLDAHGHVSKSITDLLGVGDDDDAGPTTGFDYGALAPSTPRGRSGHADLGGWGDS